MAAEVDLDVRKKFEEQMRSELSALNQSMPQVQWLKPVSVVLPVVEKNSQAEINRLFKSYGVETKFDTSSVKASPLVRILIQFVEIEKFASRRLGVEWPNSYKFQLLPKLSDLEALTVSLESLSAQGLAKVLASPSLIAKSGGEAEFLAGGEIPIPIRGRVTREVIWKKYGISLKIKPIADFQGRIDLTVNTEISSIDASTAVDGIPGIKTNKMDSSFTLLSEQTLAVSGLVKTQSGTSKSGLVGLSDIPILGSLFSSRNFLEQKSEMVIFVTPELVNASR
jgi:pilus assembly protein CpaC